MLKGKNASIPCYIMLKKSNETEVLQQIPMCLQLQSNVVYIFQIRNSVRSDNLRFTPSGCKDIGMSKFDFVAKNQFLSR